MAPDLMGNHSNFRGLAVFNVIFDENGKVVKATAISGHGLGIHFLITAAGKWQFKPFVRNGKALKACGNLTVKFAMVENVPSAEAVSPK